MIHTLTIILNWNNATDTILVAHEVLKHHKSSVVIVDNNSGDNSQVEIYSFFKKIKPNIGWEKESDCKIEKKESGNSEIYLVSMEENYGFAKSINKIIRKILQGGYRYVWLLNNDAIPSTNALSALEDEMESDQNLGFAGSVIVDYKERNKIQCCGVKYFPYLGISKLVLKSQDLSSVNQEVISKERIDFQHGASLLVRLSILDRIGLMDEGFFLYFEEQDWQIRAAEMGYLNKLVIGSKVFHKGSMSTEHSKHLFFFFYNSSAVLYSLKHNNFLQIFFSFIGILLMTIKRTKLKAKSLFWGLKGIINGVKTYKP
jgi:GT2 family glycosyltransferase